MSEPQVTMTGPARLRALAADLELIRADMEAFDLRQLAALWEADRSALERARAVLEDWRSTTPYTGSFRRAADELATALEGDKP